MSITHTYGFHQQMCMTYVFCFLLFTNNRKQNKAYIYRISENRCLCVWAYPIVPNTNVWNPTFSIEECLSVVVCLTKSGAYSSYISFHLKTRVCVVLGNTFDHVAFLSLAREWPRPRREDFPISLGDAAV